MFLPGEGADVVRGGFGNDSITLNEAVAAQDVVVLTDGKSIDTVTGFDFGGTATDDDIHFDLSELEAGRTTSFGAELSYVALDSGSSVTPGATVVLQTLTAGAAAAAGANVFLLDNGATTYADARAAVDALEDGGALELNFSGTRDSYSAFLFAYEATGGGVGVAVAAWASAKTGGFGANTLNSADLAVLTGINDVTSLTASDFAFIA